MEAAECRAGVVGVLMGTHGYSRVPVHGLRPGAVRGVGGRKGGSAGRREHRGGVVAAHYARAALYVCGYLWRGRLFMAWADIYSAVGYL